MHRTARRWISLFVSVTILFVTPAPYFAKASRPTAEPFTPDFNFTELQERDSLFKEFAEETWAPPQWGPFDVNDLVLDQDPYFMRSQRYVQAFSHAEGEGTAYQLGNGHIDVLLKGTHHALRINQPFAPLFELENYLFFKVTDPKLFTSRAQNDADVGEGVFFLDKRLVYTELRKSSDVRPVPIFFLPLEGRGWTEHIEVALFEPMTVVAMQNAQGEHQTFDIKLIDQLAHLLKGNVTIATITTLKSEQQISMKIREQFLRKQQVELPFVWLPRGSTAAFGTYVTGVNLDQPAKSLHRLAGLNSWGDLSLMPKAHAADLLSADVMTRLLIVGGMTSAVYITGVLAQMTILKDRMLERRAYIEAKEDEVARKEGQPLKDRTGTFFKVKRVFKESIDVFSHGLATLSSAPGTLFGYLLEYGADRFLGSKGRSPNALIRRFLKNTFLYSRLQNERIACNWNSFMLGVLILGGIDTFFVGVQLLYVSPFFFPLVAGLFGDEMKEKISKEMSGGDENINNVVTSEILRNFAGYFVSGAYAYSSKQRQVFLEIVRPEVEAQMRREGKDFKSSQYNKEYERRIEARLELVLVERGLPSNKEFLFSGPSFIRSAAHLMGYEIPREELYESRDWIQASGKKFVTEEDKRKFVELRQWRKKKVDELENFLRDANQYPENKGEIDRITKDIDKFKAATLRRMEAEEDHEAFVLEKARWGILSHVLKRALDATIELATVHPGDQRIAAAVEILRETKDKYHTVLNVLKQPWKARQHLREGKQVRKMLTVLSYEGDIVGSAVRYLDLWDAAKENPEAATIAARQYRQALFAVIEAKPGYLKPGAEDLAKHLPEATLQAEEELRKAPTEVGYNETDRDLIALEIVKQKVEAEKQAVADSAWTEPKQGLLEKFQRAQAHRRAMARVEEEFGTVVDMDTGLEMALASGDANMVLANAKNIPGSLSERALVERPEIRQAYKEAYREELAKIVNLKILPPEESELVRKAMAEADSDITQNMERNNGWRHYFDQLDEVGQVRFLTHQYADAFLAKYVEMTVSNSTVVGLTSPEQPGQLQKWRYKLFGKKIETTEPNVGFFKKLKSAFVPSTESRFGRAINLALRAIESPMDNTAYRPGLSKWLRRNIPWYQDVKTELSIQARTFVGYLAVAYWVQYYIWQVKFTFPVAVFFFMASGITAILSFWLDRLMMNMGYRPMNTVWDKVKYSILYSWLTYPSYLPFFFFVRDFEKWWNANITAPLASAGSAIMKSCEKLLGSIF